MAQQSNLQPNSKTLRWVEGELRLAGMLDTRMLALLKAIEETGSINQAAKRSGLSYKGAWQIIERANNLAPKVLITTATGGNKGGGTSLTEAGRALLNLYIKLEQQHQAFITQLNANLADDPDMLLLLTPLTIKTSATNQLFGKVTSILPGAVNGEVHIELKGGEHIIASVTLDELRALALKTDAEVLLLINAAEILLTNTNFTPLVSTRNRLTGEIIRVRRDGVDAEVTVKLAGGDSLVAMITQVSCENMGLRKQDTVQALFKTNAPILAAFSPDRVENEV